MSPCDSFSLMISCESRFAIYKKDSNHPSFHLLFMYHIISFLFHSSIYSKANICASVCVLCVCMWAWSLPSRTHKPLNIHTLSSQPPCACLPDCLSGRKEKKGLFPGRLVSMTTASPS